MKRECLHPHEIPVEVVTKLPGMPWYDKLIIGSIVALLVGAVALLVSMTHLMAYQEGQRMGEDVEPDYLRVELDPPVVHFRTLTIYDGSSADYINYSHPVNRY